MSGQHNYQGECVIEGIKITNPQKIVFNEPQITKQDLALYYQKIAPRMLPFLDNRIISAIRCPGGTGDKCFFKKHPDNNGGIAKIEIESGSGKIEQFYYIPDCRGLISEVQMNTVEFHIWGSRADNPERPDIMVFDLDPDEGMDISDVRQGVRDLRSILKKLSLTAFLKTSGGKGYHVIVPMQPSADWESFRDFAKNVVRLMEEKWPGRYVSNVRKASRKNKIFIDWIRNTRGATAAAPYSVRAKTGAPVSMPIAWSELDKITPDGISIDEALKRIKKKDPWAGFFEIQQG